MSTHPCNCEPDVPPEVEPDEFLNDPDGTYLLPETEPFLIPLCLTRPQYQAIIDSLTYAQGLLSDNGCYNERTAVELLLAHLPYANKPLEIPCMDTCDIISQCIETSPGTQTAISNFMTEFLINNPSFMGELTERVREIVREGLPLDLALYGGNLVPDEISDTCQADELYGAVLGIVDYFNAAITDVFEKYEQASNTIEAAAIAAGLAPGVGSTAENAIEIADQIQETLAEAYQGEYDIEFRDDLACDLFCAAIDNDCHITLETINGVLLDRLGQVDFEDLASLIVYITTGALTGDQIPEAAFLLVVNALRFGSRFSGILGLTPVAAIAKRAAEQDPSNAWEELCDCEPPGSYQVIQSNVYSGSGTVTDDNRLFGEETFTAVPNADGTPGDRYYIRLDFPVAVNVQHISYTGSQAVGDLNPFETFTDYIPYPSGAYLHWNYEGVGDNTTLPYVNLDNPPEGDMTRLFFQSDVPFSITVDVQPA